MLPFTVTDIASYHLQPGDKIYIPGIRKALEDGSEAISALLVRDGMETELPLSWNVLRRRIAISSWPVCLINYYAKA